MTVVNEDLILPVLPDLGSCGGSCVAAGSGKSLLATRHGTKSVAPTVAAQIVGPATSDARSILSIQTNSLGIRDRVSATQRDSGTGVSREHPLLHVAIERNTRQGRLRSR